MKRSAIILAEILVLATGSCFAEVQPRKDLDIYFLDMAGGASTLIVTPLGESVLIDTGSREPEHRDAERIHRACRHAGLGQIDWLITTHFDSDHFGGILEVTNRIPVKCFMDKGALPALQQQQTNSFKKLYALYQEATKDKAKPLRAGDDVGLRNDPEDRIPPIKLHCVASEKKVEGFAGDIDALVQDFQIKKPDNTDNARSIALVLHYGRFEFFAGGDITWNVEHHLAHPVNRVGQVDLYQVTHHGLDQSNNPILLEALQPTVCVAMNGPRKGIQPNTFRALKSLPSVKAIYQIHYNTLYGDDSNTQAEFIANKEDPQKGEFIKVPVRPDEGIFTVSIGPDGPTRTFAIQ